MNYARNKVLHGSVSAHSAAMRAHALQKQNAGLRGQGAFWYVAPRCGGRNAWRAFPAPTIRAPCRPHAPYRKRDHRQITWPLFGEMRLPPGRRPIAGAIYIAEYIS